MVMITAIFLLSFINVGFISILQRLMHELDHDIEGNNPSPWRTELLYTLYFTAVTAFVFVMAIRSSPLERLMWVNCSMILMMSYTDAEEYFQNYSELSIIAMDIDNFKQINDTYGHLAGNATLIQFSKRLEKLLSQQTNGARLYRTGGEEFTILYPGVTGEAVVKIAEELQDAVHNLQTKTEKGERISVTVSMGVENRRDSDRNALEIFKRADQLLYQSKRSGKNRISIGTKH